MIRHPLAVTWKVSSTGSDLESVALFQCSSTSNYIEDRHLASSNVGRSSSYNFLRESQDTFTSFVLDKASHRKSLYSRQGEASGFSHSLTLMTHVEHLLYCALHLRFLSVASTEMQDCNQ